MRQLTVVTPGELRWLDVPEPELQTPADALVRPIAVTTCDVDPVIIDGRFPLPTPIPIGHEFVAEIVDVGDEVGSLHPGQQVVVPFQISCGRCDRCVRGLTAHCRAVAPLSQYGHGAFGGNVGGAFSDLVRVPFAQHMLLPVPDGVTPRAVACAGDCLCDGWRAVAPHLMTSPGARVLILGGIGSIPLYAVDVAQALGAARVDYLDSDRTRLDIAERLGAHPIEGIIPDKAGEYEITVDGTFLNPAGLRCALQSLEPEGVCTSVTIHLEDPPIPFYHMYLHGVRFCTGRVNARAVMPEVLSLVREGRIHPERVATEIVAWEHVLDAFTELSMKPVFVRKGLYEQ